MGKKITQYTAVTSTNPDTGSLIDISEKSGSTYVTKKWTLLQMVTWLKTLFTTADVPDSTNKRYVTDAQLVVIGNTSNTNTGDETNATIKTKLGIASAINAGYMTAQNFGLHEQVTTQLSLSSLDTAITSGTNKGYWVAPYDGEFKTSNGLVANLLTAQSSGGVFTIDVNKNGSTILSTKLTIDNSETTSGTATTPYVITDTTFNEGDIFTFDIDQVGDSVCRGALLTLRYIYTA